MNDVRSAGGDIENESKRLAKAFLERDERAFDKLIILHKKMVFNLCYRFLGDYDDADDCAQEVFIKVHRSLGRFRFESSFGTWLYRITVNTCKNRLKSLEYRLRSRSMRIDMASSSDGCRKTGVAGQNPVRPDSKIISAEADRMIRSAVDTLPASQKLIVVLRDYEGRSYEEITELTGLRIGTVKSRLSRARLHLREVLDGKI